MVPPPLNRGLSAPQALCSKPAERGSPSLERLDCFAASWLRPAVTKDQASEAGRRAQNTPSEGVSLGRAAGGDRPLAGLLGDDLPPGGVERCPSKTWCITGYTLDDLAREHGDALLALKLDVTDRGAVFETVRQAHEHFGQLEFGVKNAGYGSSGWSRSSARPRHATRSRPTLEIAQQDYERRLASWREWQPVAELAQGRD